MLKSLMITNFALIENAFIDFPAGLTIVTGETGAGKSIFIDAINMIIGSRASIDLIRTGCEFFRIEAVLEVENPQLFNAVMDEQGIDWEDENLLIISRRLSSTGKNTIVLNGCQVSLNVLRQFGSILIDIHGQHENQALLQSEFHMQLLDRYNKQIIESLIDYRGLYEQWQELKKELALLEAKEHDFTQRTDMLKWQVQEIAAANLSNQEEEELEQQLHVLAHAEKITGAVTKAYNFLVQGDHGANGILANLTEVKKELLIACKYDPSLDEISSVIMDAQIQLDETCQELRLYCERIDYNPQKLQTLQERMDLIYRLRKKYGSSVNEILIYYEQALRELEDIEHHDEHLEAKNKVLAKLENQMTSIANIIDKMRRETAEKLSSKISEQLADLGMPKAKIIFKIDDLQHFDRNGRNQISLFFSANPGEEPRPIRRVVSGGELSRLALAIKVVCSASDDVETMIFDEIDAGIGGATAQMVAERIAMVAAYKQVICITHLPQIACMADCHIYIEKKQHEERAQTVIKNLVGNEQIQELVRMMSGGDATQLAMENAQQILQTAQKKKEKWKNPANS